MDFSVTKHPNPYCTQMGLKRACGAFLSPPHWSAEGRTTTPVPSSKEGDYGGRNEIFSNLRLARCKAADPWLWLAGLSVCSKREGVPLPRSGGGREGADAPAAPYKRRRVGRNLRLSRADPALCSGQPSPLRCILLSPQGLTTLRGPRLYGVYRRVGSLGRSPE